ncbi:MAG: AMP-binding protein [Solirubrobacterales bacterium]|nr:AMP-binding protein [Solirubrobacterales bacterium]
MPAAPDLARRRRGRSDHPDAALRRAREPSRGARRDLGRGPLRPRPRGGAVSAALRGGRSVTGSGAAEVPALEPVAPAPFDERTACWGASMPASAEGLREWQLRRAWEVAGSLAASNPFYAPRLRLPAGRDAASFRGLPVTGKEEVVADCAAVPPYGSRTVSSPHDHRHVVETSGTSGGGHEVYALDADDELAVFRAAAVGFWWAGVRAGTGVLLTLPVGMTAAGIWYYGALRTIGANVLSAGAYPATRKVAALTRYRPRVLVGTPSYVDRLAAACRDEGVDPATAGVASIVVAGEPYSVEWAIDVERSWNARLHEQYGSTERVMAWSCPNGAICDGALGTLHFPPELCYWEVIDPETREPAADGEHGELICTPLAAEASPLLRFASRDRVRFVAAGSCACGRPLPGIRAGGVERYDDMMKIRGVNVWPASFDAAVFGVSGALNYRGSVRRAADGRELVELVVEGDPRERQSLAGPVREAVHRLVGLAVEVTVVAPGSLARDVPEGFVKVSRWTDQRRPGATR